MNGLSLEERKTRAEIANLVAAKRKAVAEAEKAEYEMRETQKRRSFFERVLSTTQATVALALFTLFAQIVQFAVTSRETRKAEESKEWKDAVRDVSFAGDAKAVAAALNIETFLHSDTYESQAKQLSASVLPYIQDPRAFDEVFEPLVHSAIREHDGSQLYTVANAIAVAYSADADPVYSEARKSGKPPALWGRYHEELSNLLLRNSPSQNERSAEVVEARLREWEIDTVTHGLVDFLSKQQEDKSWWVRNQGADLRRIILRMDDDAPVDLSGLDLEHASLKGSYLRTVSFSKARLQETNLDDADLETADLTAARLDGASVSGANLGNVTKFGGSVWNGVAWWTAARLSPELCSYLGHLPPSTPDKAPAVVKACSARDAEPATASSQLANGLRPRRVPRLSLPASGQSLHGDS